MLAPVTWSFSPAESAWIERNRSAPSRRAISARSSSDEEPVVVPRQRDADAALPDKFVAQRLRQTQRQGLLLEPFAHRARIVTAMAGVDHHQRAAGVLRPLDRRKADVRAGLGQHDADHVAAAQHRDGHRQPQQVQPADEHHRQQEYHEDLQAMPHSGAWLSVAGPSSQGIFATSRNNLARL